MSDQVEAVQDDDPEFTSSEDLLARIVQLEAEAGDLEYELDKTKAKLQRIKVRYRNKTKKMKKVAIQIVSEAEAVLDHGCLDIPFQMETNDLIASAKIKVVKDIFGDV